MTSADTLFTDPQPLSLCEYTRRLRGVVTNHPALSGQWVSAELSDVALRGGHCYLELVEKGPAGETLAKMRATIWRSVYAPLASKFMAATGRQLASGLKVLLRGSGSFHEVYGLSFNVTDIDPSYTMGDLERIRREILSALKKEGVIDRNRNLPLPVAPRCIAVISAPGAAGYGDFLSQLDGNSDGFVFYHTLFEAVMQGNMVTPTVLDALDRIEETIDLWDAVVIIRGGGATTDLTGFDTLELAHRVATFSLPVIVGIGHERDRTVLDEIAAVRVKTPTAAAEFLVGECRKAYEAARGLAAEIVRAATARIENSRSRLAQFEAAIPALGRKIIASASEHLTRLAANIPMAVSGRIAAQQAYLAATDERIKLIISQRFTREDDRLQQLDSMISLLSPQATLKRGYSITRVEGKAVTDPGLIPDGAEIITTLAGGEVRSKVKK